MTYEEVCPFDAEGIRATEYAGDEKFAAIYNLAPILPGHSMIVPRRHVERLLSLDDQELCEFFTFGRRVTEFLVSQFRADGFNWTIQDSVAAGQTVPHIHLHIILRWQNDLPAPGDWYERLNLPVQAETGGPIDSDARTKLSPDEMSRMVKTLSEAASARGLVSRGVLP